MKVDRILPFSICAVIIVSFYAVILKNSVDIPNGDDIYCLLLFTQQFQDALSWGERFHLLVQQWVEHRILYSRLTALISYVIHGGQVNFITIILIGNLTLVAFTALFWKFLNGIKASGYYLIPIVLTLFSPVMYEANLWAGACTVYMPVCFMGLLSVYLISKKTALSFTGAIVIALLATYSFGNGMFSFVAGIVVLVMQKRFKELVIWVPVMVAAIFLYFQNFYVASATNAFSFSAHFQHPTYLFYNLFAFIGGSLDYTESSNAPIQMNNVLGICFGVVITIAVLTGLYPILLKRILHSREKTERSEVIWVGMVAFIAITALSMAYSRTSGESINTLSSRYKIFSMVSFILVYIWLLKFFPSRKVIVGCLFGMISLLMLGVSYYTTYDKLSNFKSTLLAGLYNYNNNHHWVIYRHTSYYEVASQAVSDTIKSKNNPVFEFQKVFPGLTLTALNAARGFSDVRVSEERNCNGNTGNCITIASDGYPTISNFFRGIYLVVYNDKNIYLFPTNPKKNGRVNMLTKGNYFKPGFDLIDNFGKSLEPGVEYKLAIYCPTENEQIRLINYKIKG